MVSGTRFLLDWCVKLDFLVLLQLQLVLRLVISLLWQFGSFASSLERSPWRKFLLFSQQTASNVRHSSP